MPGVRGDGPDLPLLGIQAEGEQSLVGHPEALGKKLLKLAGLTVELKRARRLPYGQEDLRHQQPGRVPVALDFAGRDGRLDLLPALVDDAVVRVLPALVLLPLR